MTDMLTRSFSKRELACKCCGVCNMDQELLTRLQTFRDLLGAPLVIASAYRCPRHNKAVGGASGSMHLQGKAVDPVIIPKLRFRRIDLAHKLEFSGIGLGKSKMHLDLSPKVNRSWSY